MGSTMTVPLVAESGTKEPMVFVIAGKAVTFSTAPLVSLGAMPGVANEVVTFEDWPA